MEIQHLADFVELSQCESLSDAAPRLGITQSALSKRIKHMENELGVTLIDRSAPGIRLTPEGEDLRLCALDVTNHYRNLINDFKRVRNRPTIRVGGMLHDQLVGALLDDVEAGTSALKLLRDERSYDLLGMPLERNELDVFFAPIADRTELAGKAVEQILLKRERAYATMRCDNPLAGKTVLSADDIRDCYLIRLASGHETDDGWHAIERMCVAKGFSPKVNIMNFANGSEIRLRDAIFLQPESKIGVDEQKYIDGDICNVPLEDGFTFDLYMGLNPLLSENVTSVFRHAAKKVMR